MNLIKKIGSYSAATFASLVFPAIALAQGASPAGPDSGSIVPDNLPTFGIIEIVQAAIKFILVIAFIAAFIMLLIGGIRWILAGGDEKAVSGARNTITAALIGLVVVLLSFAIIKLVENFFGVTVISGDITIPTVGDSGTGN